MPITTPRRPNLVSTFCLALCASACGGGGGGTTAVTPTPTITLSGVAAKGLIKDGVISIYSTDSSGNVREQPIATTKTDANGAYSVKIPAQSSALLATVTSSLDRATKVANDLQPDQADSQLPANFTMSAVIGGAASDTVISINPFSNLAVKSAVQGGKLLTDYAIISNQYVKTYLLNGIDPVSTLPSVSTKSSNPNELAMTAALLGVAVAAEEDLICKTFATAGERYSCINTKISSAISINSDASVTVANTQVLNGLATARRNLNSSTHQTLTAALGVSTQVTAFANDEALSAVIAGASKSQTPTTPTIVAATLTFEQYANDLKRALKKLEATYGNYGNVYQYSGLTYAQQLAVHPSLTSVQNTFEFISTHCDFAGLAGTSSCQTGLRTLSWGTVNLQRTQTGSYTWTGSGGGYDIAGSLDLAVDNNSATFNLVGTIANTDPGIFTTAPIEINFGVTITQKENGKYTAAIQNSTVKYPESTAMINGGQYGFPKFVVSLSGVTLDATQYMGGWTMGCGSTVNASCVTKNEEKYWGVESINGTLTITDDWGDYGELKIASKLRIPSQSQWSAMSGYNRYLFQKNPVATDLSIMGTLSYVGMPYWYWASTGTVQIAANMKSDFSKVDDSLPYSQSNFPTGSIQVKELLSNQSASDGRSFACSASDACIDVLFQRLDYNHVQPSLSIYVGDFDKITIVPNNTDNTYALDNSAIPNSSQLNMGWLNFKQDKANPITGLKIYSSNHAFVLTLFKDNNGKFKEGLIEDKDKKTVGVVKGGFLYINGQIYSLI